MHARALELVEVELKVGPSDGNVLRVDVQVGREAKEPWRVP